MNKKKITSVALAFTLAVAAPVKANLISLDFGPSHVLAASTTMTPQQRYEAALKAEGVAEQAVKDAQQKVTDATTAVTKATTDLTTAEKAIADANAKIVEAQKIIDSGTATPEAKAAAQTAKTTAQNDLTKAEAAKTAAEQAKTTAEDDLTKAKAEKTTADEALKKAKEETAAAKVALDASQSQGTEASKFTGTLTVTKARGSSVYSTELAGLPTGATVSSQLLVSDLQSTKTGTITVTFKDNSTKSVPYTIYVTNSSVYLTKPTVYADRVSGKTDPNATVTLYKNGSYVKQTTADANGNYTIYNTFATYRNGYYGDRYYNGYRGTANISTYNNNYVDGYTTANTRVEAYNNGVYLGSTTSNSSGYYSISFNRYVSDRYNTTVYTNGYYGDRYYNGYYDYYDYYDLSQYSLVATKDGMSSSTYYLNNAYKDNYYYNYGNRYQDPLYKYDYAYSARVTSAVPGTSTVKGDGVNSYATVTVYDNDGVRLGRGTALSNGEFTISLNRNLKAGETIKVTSSYSNYRENSVTYKVSGTETKKDTYNYTVTLNIGDKVLTTVKDGKTSTTTMDVEAYIKDGRTMLPIRYVAQALGYNVTWNDVARTASFSDGKRIVIVNIDSRDFYVDGVKNTFSVDPEIKDGRTMLPVSDIGKALGMTTGNKGDNKNIEWDSVLRQVKIQLTK